ncbi:MAG: DUF2135 domain-containing protein [Kiritimatiellae bacterium]|nr:DUF2135 domain-containing protein [Kiritimatiellia bacterium]
MMKSVSFLLANVLMAPLTMLAQGGGGMLPRPLPPVIPPPNLVVQGADQAMRLQAMDVAVSIRGTYATVATTLTFFNPNKGNPLEGELVFPLPDQATVCGYALDINGAMVDGVVVPKEKARVAFETETRRKIDPGLVEHVKGNVYRTRIYPLPAGGSRSVKLVYTARLAVAPNGDVALMLPMPKEKIGKRTVTIEVADLNAPAPQIGGLGDARFAKAERFWRVATTETDVAPSEDVFVALPMLPATVSTVERDDDGTVWFTVSATAPKAPEAAPAIPETLEIIWDASGSRKHPGLALEYALIEALPDTVKTLKLKVFRDLPEPERVFTSKAELVATLKALPYDGGTDFEALAADLTADPAPAHRWLFTDGMDTLSGVPVAFKVAPQAAIVSAPVGDREALRQACSGAVIDLQAMTVKDALNQLLFAPPPRVTAVEGSGIADVQGIGAPAVGRVSVIGRLTSPESVIRINCGAAGLTEPVTVKAADAREGRTLATAWASARVSQLAPNADDFADELLALGRSYGVVSPVTSLLVLESLDQWLRHKIEPPASQPQLREQWRVAMKSRQSDEDGKRARHLEMLVKNWERHLEWWKRDYGKDPLPTANKPPRDGAANGGGGVMQRMFSRSARAAGAAPAAGRMMVAEEGVAADRDEAFAADAAAPAPAAKRSVSGSGSGVAPASVRIKAWSPDTPYLKAIKAVPVTDAYARYLEQRESWTASPAFYLDTAEFFLTAGERATGLRVLSNLAELKIEDAAMLRVYAWRLRQAKAYDRAITLLRRIVKLRGEEGQSYRDLALTLMERGKENRSKADLEEAMGLLVKCFLTPWARHADVLSLFALEEMNALVAWIDAQEWKEGDKPVVPEYDKRLQQMIDVDVRIVLSWDADATDIDLHVIEPGGEEAFYGHNRTARGGYVSRDITDGYGPEEYMIRKAPNGKYKIRVNYFASHQQTVVGPATVTATVFTHWGRKEETQQTLTFRSEKVKGDVDVGEITFGTLNPEARTAEDFSGLKPGMSEKEVQKAVGEPSGKNGTEWTYLCGKRTIRVIFTEKGKLLRVEELLKGGVHNVLVQ